jgi:hypothetical protein
VLMLDIEASRIEIRLLRCDIIPGGVVCFPWKQEACSALEQQPTPRNGLAAAVCC